MWFQNGSCRYQYGQPSTKKKPLMMMHTALQKPVLIAANQPRRWMPSGPSE